MKRPKVPLACFLVMAIFAGGMTNIHAQSLQRNPSVRLKVPPRYRSFVYGDVVSSTPDMLSFLPADSVAPVPILIGKIAVAQVLDGKRNHWVLGTVIGAAVGFVALAGARGGDMDELVNLVQTLTTLGGAAIGFTIGLLIKTDGWRDVPPSQLGNFAPTGAGLTITFSLTP